MWLCFVCADAGGGVVGLVAGTPTEASVVAVGELCVDMVCDVTI